MIAYLLVRIHRGKAALAGLASFGSDLGDLILGAVGEIAGIRIIGHDEVGSYERIYLERVIRRLVCLVEVVCWKKKLSFERTRGLYVDAILISGFNWS